VTSKFEIVDGYKLRKKVRVVIADEHGRFLLIQPHGYESDTWTLVGGGVEEGESDGQAILREIYEETGISALIALHMSTVRHWYQFSDRIKTQRKLDHDGQIAKIFFAVVASGSAVMIQKEEVRAFCWAALDQADNLINIPEQRNLFKEVIAEFKDYQLHFDASQRS
jgi:8-oxo-dGTP pyrophosphatase MutT (NUDIX family)